MIYERDALCATGSQGSQGPASEFRENFAEEVTFALCEKTQGSIYKSGLMGQKGCVFNILLDITKLPPLLVKNERAFIWHVKV